MIIEVVVPVLSRDMFDHVISTRGGRLVAITDIIASWNINEDKITCNSPSR
jgi:hypothetical protein